jgi:hypothetical protein
MNQNEADVREVITELASRAKKEQSPDRFLARAALVGLGRMELANDGSASELAGELRKAAAPLQEAWEQAVEAELTMACTEHVRSVDPRFLDQPIYDFEYTVAARERLEARFLATALLELEVPEKLLEQVAEADQLLAPYLEQR